nr:EF-P lysine aminoacylase EpmA [Spirochaetales bacterium]
PLQVMKKLHERAALLRAVRFFFEIHEYLEVETPVRNPVLIPETNILPVVSDGFFLQTSPELCMKRLLSRGYGKIFQICKCFRGQERGNRHLPEFTMLEWYRVQGDYQSLMSETADLLKFLAGKICGCSGFDPTIVAVLQQPSEFITVRDAFAMYTSYTAEQAIVDNCFDEQLVEYIEPVLGLRQPCFLYDYPAALGSLARKKKSDGSLAERFELYVQGVELANGFSELTDGPEQRRRFEIELEVARGTGLPQAAMPEKFLRDLDVMPEACGIALGFDRLVMLLTGAATIDEVVSSTPEEL